jgi:hypothetical protein
MGQINQTMNRIILSKNQIVHQAPQFILLSLHFLSSNNVVDPDAPSYTVQNTVFDVTNPPSSLRTTTTETLYIYSTLYAQQCVPYCQLYIYLSQLSLPSSPNSHLTTHTHTTNMPAFYPFIPANSTMPYTHNTTSHNATLHAAVAAPSLVKASSNSNEAGTSLSMAGIIAIITAVIVLFSGLAWLVYHAFVTLPARKKAAFRGREAA